VAIVKPSLNSFDANQSIQNDVSEEEQRWGSKTVQGSGRNAGAIE
jgi:cortactin